MKTQSFFNTMIEKINQSQSNDEIKALNTVMDQAIKYSPMPAIISNPKLWKNFVIMDTFGSLDDIKGLYKQYTAKPITFARAKDLASVLNYRVYGYYLDIMSIIENTDFNKADQMLLKIYKSRMETYKELFKQLDNQMLERLDNDDLIAYSDHRETYFHLLNER